VASSKLTRLTTHLMGMADIKSCFLITYGILTTVDSGFSARFRCSIQFSNFHFSSLSIKLVKTAEMI
jgi:hypothetical protein